MLAETTAERGDSAVEEALSDSVAERVTPAFPPRAAAPLWCPSCQTAQAVLPTGDGCVCTVCGVVTGTGAGETSEEAVTATEDTGGQPETAADAAGDDEEGFAL